MFCSLFLREEKPKAFAFGFFVLWRVDSANFLKRHETKKHKRPARALVFIRPGFPLTGSTKLIPFTFTEDVTTASDGFFFTGSLRRDQRIGSLFVQQTLTKIPVFQSVVRFFNRTSFTWLREKRFP